MNREIKLPYLFAKNTGLLLTAATGAIGADAGEQSVLVRAGCAPAALAELRRKLNCRLVPTVVTVAEFDRQLGEAFGAAEQSAAEVADDLNQEFDLSRLADELPQIEDLLASSDDAPVIRMINALLSQAVRDGASDVHVEPFEGYSAVRFRIDGALRDVLRPPRGLHTALVSRIKIMAQLDISEKRLPQDGRVTVRLARRSMDIRVSTVPTGHGERVVMRLLDKDPSRLVLDGLGMAPDTLIRFDELIRRPHGIVLVTGPTGSGKTTTLYSAMSRFDATSINIMTVEDPVEYDLPNIGQTQVNPRIELTFAKALRSILRQDPDVIMIGEIRDFETAQIAVQASLTGHLVLATLHTNDSASAVTRLIDMGIEPFLLASSLGGVLAQRLVRRLCPHCKVTHPADANELVLLGDYRESDVLFRPKGCAECANTGYLGRIGIYELLEIDDEILRMIHSRRTDVDLRDYAVANLPSYRPLRVDGMRWVARGETSLEEVLRVTRD